MIDRLTLTDPSLTERANAIYGTAQSAVNDRLWRAALGITDEAPGPSASLGATLIAPFPFPAAGIPAAAIAPAASPSTEPAVAPATNQALDPASLGRNGRYAATLSAAAQRTGIPAHAMAAIIDAEAGKSRDGSWQTYARNPRSSAAGLGQFLSGTWTGLAERHGTWLNQTAKAKGWLDEAGHVLSSARSALLSLRYQPDAAINTIADYAKLNLDGLKRAGVTVSNDVTAIARTIYTGHYLGLGDAVRYFRDQLTPARAHQLLTAQVGRERAGTLIARAGNAVAAHEQWLAHRLDSVFHARADV